MSRDLCRVTVSGRLTRDPELRSLPSGTAICSIRLAYSTPRKDASGEWTDKSNYVDVTVWGKQGENCATYLSKGRPIIVDGRLEWREWQTEGGGKRQAHEVVADSVIFLNDGKDGGGGGGGGSGFEARSDAPPAGGGTPPPSGSGGTPPTGDDDIPF